MEVDMPFSDDPVLDPRLFHDDDKKEVLVLHLRSVIAPPPSLKRKVTTGSWNSPDEAYADVDITDENLYVRPHSGDGVVVHFLPNGHTVPKRSPVVREKKNQVVSSHRIDVRYEELPADLLAFLDPHVKFKAMPNGGKRYLNVSPQPGGGFQVQFWIPTIKRHNRLATVTDDRVGGIIVAAATLDPSLRERFAPLKWLYDIMEKSHYVKEWLESLECVA